MMLVRSSIDAHLSSVPDHGKQEISCVWIPSDQSWQEHLNAATVTEHKHKDDSLSSRNLLSSSQLSTEANMSETSKPNLVYKRRMIQRNTQNSKPTLVYKRKKVQTGFPAQVSTNSCSSSKSNMELGSAPLKHQADDVGECSSSGVVIVEGLRKDILKGTNSCIAFLGEHLVLERFRSNKPIRVEKNVCCLRACKCKVCDRSTTTLKMLICDLCEESFHMSCCNPPVKKVPVGGDWFCHSCSRKKLKKLQETSSGKSPKGYSGPIASMLRDVDPYKSDVRIGKDFQAEIPDWSGPLTDELNDYSEPMEISPLKCASYQDWDSSKLSRLSSIGNWLQCRETVDHVNGTVCGKWRR